MASWRNVKQLDDDFNEEKYFNDDQDDDVDEAVNQRYRQKNLEKNKNNSQQNASKEEEVDELELYMAQMQEQANKDLASIGKDEKRKQQERFIEDDPMDSYMDSVKKKLITEAQKNQPNNNKNQDDEDDPQNFDFLDSDGEVDFAAVKKMKKENFEILDNVNHDKNKYQEVSKNFYMEHQDITNMDKDVLKKYIEEKQLRVKGIQAPRPIISFAHLNFDDVMMSQITKQEFVTPTPIQAQALPCILSGRDVVGVAKTGSGKTLAYIWPMIYHILDQNVVEKNEGPIGVILAPTRELCQQIYLEVRRYARHYDLSVTALLGGENKTDQWKNLKAGTDVIVATPGRLMEMVQKKATNLLRCSYAVVDEADKMFSMGFEKQIRSILQNARPDKQTLLFTATLKKSIQNLVMDVLNDPLVIHCGMLNQANEDVKQEVAILRNDTDKLKWMIEYLFTFMAQGKLLIFVNQIAQCELLCTAIRQELGFGDILTLHGNKLQQERTEIINEFKKGEKLLMIATDVASRGLDVPQIRNVINFEPPKDADTHIHRVGRTGRGGDKMGTAYTLITDMDIKTAVMLVKNFQVSGQTVTPELEMIAMKDDKFKLKKMTKNLGVDFAKGKDASKLLKQALSRQRKTKAGLGFSETADTKVDKKKAMEKEADRLLNITKQHQYLDAQEYRLKMQEQQQKQLLESQFKSQFTKSAQQNEKISIKDNQIVPKRGFSKTITQDQQQMVSQVDQEREQIQRQFQENKKMVQQSSFRSAFQSAGTIQSSQKIAPTISYFTKAKGRK